MKKHFDERNIFASGYFPIWEIFDSKMVKYFQEWTKEPYIYDVHPGGETWQKLDGKIRGGAKRKVDVHFRVLKWFIAFIQVYFYESIYNI